MTWLWVTIAVVLDGAVALVGGLLPERWLDRYQPAMLGFAAGTLLASGLGEILPEAISISGVTALGWTVGAMLALGAFEHASARRERHHQRPVVPVALLGSDALHNLADGMAIAAAFVVSPRVGVFTAAAVVIHELPEEIADYALLRVAGMSKRSALAALAGVQLTAALGAAGTLAASGVIADANGPILAIACGMFVYIAVFDLMPDLIRTRSRSAVLACVVGVAIVLALS
jgi:zinc and cadmium transporter